MEVQNYDDDFDDFEVFVLLLPDPTQIPPSGHGETTFRATH